MDFVRVSIKAGKGGDGSVSFRRERFIPMGGPDGGDGGKGGSIYFETDPNTNTLDIFSHNQKIWAKNGKGGMGKKMSGSMGDDLVTKVPVGTILRLKATDGRLNDLSTIDFDKPGMSICVAKGGKGGRGNVHFKSSRNTTPTEAEKGFEGESFEAELELKLLADIGLVGLPNAGKSTLLSVLSNARPKVADYEFTTLEPNLGVMRIQDRNLVIADIPGLVEGASEGRGLGVKFLRHIERTKTLIHLVSVTGGDEKEIYAKYQLIRKELTDFGAGLEDKKEIVVLSKIDLVEGTQPTSPQRQLSQSDGQAKLGGLSKVQEVVNFFRKRKINILPISSGNGEGLEELKSKLL